MIPVLSKFIELWVKSKTKYQFSKSISGLSLKDFPSCNKSTNEELATIIKNLRKNSYKVKPKPCSTMRILVVTDMQMPQKMLGGQNHAEGPLEIIVNFPIDYTEIKQERVSMPIIICLTLKKQFRQFSVSCLFFR